MILLKTTLFMMLMKMSLVEEDVSSQAGRQAWVYINILTMMKSSEMVIVSL